MKQKTQTDVEKIISNSKEELEKMPYYDNINKQYKKLSEELKSSLTTTQKENFDKIIKLFNNLKSYEGYIVYKVGFEDGVKYKKTFENKWFWACLKEVKKDHRNSF